MNNSGSRALCATFLLFLPLSSWGQGQANLTLGSGAGVAGGTVSLPITLADTGNNQIVGLQWAFAWSAANFTSITITASPSLTAVSKSIVCGRSAIKFTCLAMGSNANVIPNGQIATATFTLAATALSRNVALAGALGVSAYGNAVAITPTDGVITVLPTLSSFICRPTMLNSGVSGSCTLTLSQTAAGGSVTVPLSSSNPVLRVPASATVAAGSDSGNVIVSAGIAAVSQTGAVTATLNGSQISVNFTVNPAAPATNLGGAKRLTVARESRPSDPVIRDRGVVNTASGTDGGLAPGSLFTIYGSALGPEEKASAEEPPYPTALGGVRVAMKRGEREFDAALLLASEGQINAIVPDAIPPGDVDVVVTNGNRSSAPAAAQVVAASIGVFHRELAGQEMAVAETVRRGTGGRLVTAESPARPGEVVDLWVTGLGTLTEQDAADLSVTLAGMPAERVMARRGSEAALADHILFRVPEGIQPVCPVLVGISIRGVAANATYLPLTADGSACK